jgi:hypothetical protein
MWPLAKCSKLLLLFLFVFDNVEELLGLADEKFG